MAAVKNVTHTDVKKLKEIHLLSKSLKAELSALATRRFLRLRETSTERVIGLMTVWAQRTYFLRRVMDCCLCRDHPFNHVYCFYSTNIDEEDAATAEMKALGELIGEIERQFANVDVTGDGISQAFFGKSRMKG